MINNKTNNDLKDSDVIKVLELSGSYKDAFGVTTTFQYEDYQAIEDNRNYILYLDESRSDPGVYIIGAVNYGKIPLDTEKKATLLDKKENYINEKVKMIHNQAKENTEKKLTI